MTTTTATPPSTPHRALFLTRASYGATPRSLFDGVHDNRPTGILVPYWTCDPPTDPRRGVHQQGLDLVDGRAGAGRSLLDVRSDRAQRPTGVTLGPWEVNTLDLGLRITSHSQLLVRH